MDFEAEDAVEVINFKNWRSYKDLIFGTAKARKSN
jgi:hypothetical protein